MNKINRFFLMICAALTLSLAACDDDDDVTPPQPLDMSGFAKGADVSWVTQMETSGHKFYNAQGTEMECMKLLRSLGTNSIRLRVWVNPSDGWCNKEDLLVKAFRANALGMRIMVDFHYSDSWADPSKQTKPQAWQNMTFSELNSALSAHTIEVLTLLKDNGITPEWVQVGNETGNGMLWDEGKASLNMSNYAALHNTGYDAVKSVFPQAKVVVHIQNGQESGVLDWIIGGLHDNGAKFDVVGVSLYPDETNYQAFCAQCLTNMNSLVSTYGCEVMVCEVGMSSSLPEVCKSFLQLIIADTKKVKNNKGIGVFYWEPECNSGWNSYHLGAFDDNGMPTAALDAFAE